MGLTSVNVAVFVQTEPQTPVEDYRAVTQSHEMK